MAAEPPVAKGNESPSRSEAIRVAPPRYGWGGSNCPDSSAQEEIRSHHHSPNTLYR
ncbi:UNVERIFIED_CONTAM: hypothetical protein Sradi_4390300 [Sesamum radiatum]|uniref:Uncharacterized protein n=1 Tax=Sesamum radiatum TaxID=300843 RepID=A0AAW2NQ08_SESRA